MEFPETRFVIVVCTYSLQQKSDETSVFLVFKMKVVWDEEALGYDQDRKYAVPPPKLEN